jgi:nicotinamidase-related amidase
MTPRLQLGYTALLVVDMQERLLPAIEGAAAVTQQVARLIDAAAVLELPVLVTEQYPKGLGRTVPDICRRLNPGVQVQEKLRFSACTEATRAELMRLGARAVLVCGIEAHVCVLQTCLDLIDAGFVTAVAVDAIGSRRCADRETAVARMTQAGILPTSVESAVLELLGEAGGQRFKALLPLIK